LFDWELGRDGSGDGLGKKGIVYDMQEQFRFVIDLAITDLIENNKMEKKDFVRTESFTLGLGTNGAQKSNSSHK
jgi:CRISPR-associated protein Cas1